MNKEWPISNRLWKYRKERGYTQIDVAKLLKLKTSTQICNWERGKSLPNVVQLMDLSALYQRLANDLLWDLFCQERKKMKQREGKLLNKKADKSDRASRLIPKSKHNYPIRKELHRFIFVILGFTTN